MSNLVPLNRHQKKALVIQLYEQGKTRRQIAEVVHMGFKDIADVIRKHTGASRRPIQRIMEVWLRRLGTNKTIM